jgi:aryl-alcohol dehydrogenase-like predicted oxidoreductase
MGMSAGYGPSSQNKTESIRVLQRAVELGVTLKTADVYGPFTNEEFVGEGLSRGRHEVTLAATKCGLVLEGVWVPKTQIWR